MSLQFFNQYKLLLSFLLYLLYQFCIDGRVLLIMPFICGRFDYVISGYYDIISVMSQSMSVSLERLSRSMHFDSIYPLLREYQSVIPGGQYLINIFFSFIQTNNIYPIQNIVDIKMKSVIRDYPIPIHITTATSRITISGLIAKYNAIDSLCRCDNLLSESVWRTKTIAVDWCLLNSNYAKL